MIDQQDIKNITAAFDPDHAAFVQSDFAVVTAHRLAQHHRLSDEQTTSLHGGIQLYLLTVFTDGDLANHIEQHCGLSSEEAEQLVNALLDILPPSFAQLHEETRQALSAPKTAVATPPPAPKAPKAAPVPKPNPIPTPPSPKPKPIPTPPKPAGDNKDVPTYSSTQSAILKEGKSSPVADKPRWGSEQ